MSHIAKMLRQRVGGACRGTLRIARRTTHRAWGPLENARYWRRNAQLQTERKILYALTPPPRLANVGDQAQAVAIHRWLRKHFPALPVLECDKDEVLHCLRALRRLIGPDDVIFLHSGGNLGDRGLWSETGRRSIISAFPDNRIVSLPQTIYFSDTPGGRREREISRTIYARHPRLTVLGRDEESATLAAGLFPTAQTFALPDFVLSLEIDERRYDCVAKGDVPRVLLCLRKDNESALSKSEYEQMRSRLPYACEYYDTTLDHPIPRNRREEELDEVLRLIGRFDAVVTDRYHGLIFSVLCRKPAVVLPTVDHKLTSAMGWFEGVPFVALAPDVEAVPDLLGRLLACQDRWVPDWNAAYFDTLPAKLGLACAGVGDLERSQIPSGDARKGQIAIRQARPHGQESRMKMIAASSTVRTGMLKIARYIDRLVRIAFTPWRFRDLLASSRADPYDTVARRSVEEILGAVRHEAHRIEKAVYTGLLQQRAASYQAKHSRLGRLLDELDRRGHPSSDVSVAWAREIHDAFPDVERRFVQTHSATPAKADSASAAGLLEEFASRRSVRVWAARQPEERELREIAEQMIEAARWAPNSGNRQALRFRVITSPAEKQLLEGLKETHCIAAPLLMFVGADKRLYGALAEDERCVWLDAGAAIMQMILLAHRCGLGTCWNHFAADLIGSRPANVARYETLCRALGIPAYIEPVAIVAVGIPRFLPPVPQRMPREAYLIPARSEGAR